MNKSPVIMRAVTGSAAIVSEGYDPNTKTLFLRFTKAESPTEIPGVDVATYREFLAADSKGKFFHEKLKQKIGMPEDKGR